MWKALAALALASSTSLPLAQASLAGASVGDEVRWSYGPFAFEGEPVLAGERVLVAGRDPTGRRALVVLDSESGRVLSRTLFAASRPLAPAAVGDWVAVRSAPGRVDVHRLRGARLLTARSIVHAESVSAPCLVDDQLVLREGDELSLYQLEEREALWRARVPGEFHGAPAVDGGSVFGAWYAPDGVAHLLWLERASGKLLGDVVLGRGDATKPPAERDALVVVPHPTSVFVHLADGIKGTSGAVFAWARVPFDGTHLGTPVSLHDLLATPLALDDGWVAPERGAEGSARWLLVRREPGASGRERVIELASRAHHAWLAEATIAASRAGDVLYLGPCAADAKSLQVEWRRERVPAFPPVPSPAGLLVVEGETLRCLGAPPPAPERGRERALATVQESERALGEALAQVAHQALRAGEGELATRLTDEAETLGANARALTVLRAGIESLRPGAAALRDAARAALAEAERAARSRQLDGLAGAARITRDPVERRTLLGELFRRAPEHPGGAEILRGLLPPGASRAAGDALAWLGFLELSERRAVTIVPAPGAERLSPAQTRLRDERANWRADASGYESDRLLVATAATSPVAVARALHAGELVCDVLEQTFGGARVAAGKLEVVLYPTRAEYLEHSGSDLGGLETVLGFTAGHFDLAAEVSRLYLPEDDAENARLLGVSAHELTHHWLATRSRFGPPRGVPEATGFWVVEAIATWAEELHLDTARWGWSTDPRRAASLDTLANAGADDLLPWRELLGLSFTSYCALETRPTCSLALDWQLGAQAPRSPMQLFYAQSGAVAHWLYEADDGARRDVLLRAVEAYYRGEPLDVARELGLSPETLGERVVAWAKSAERRGIVLAR